MTAAGDPHAIHGPWQLNHPMNIEIITINLKSSMEFLSFNRIANDVCNEFLFYFIFDFLSNEAISTVRKEC